MPGILSAVHRTQKNKQTGDLTEERMTKAISSHGNSLTSPVSLFAFTIVLTKTDIINLEFNLDFPKYISLHLIHKLSFE